MTAQSVNNVRLAAVTIGVLGTWFAALALDFVVRGGPPQAVLPLLASGLILDIGAVGAVRAARRAAPEHFRSRPSKN